MTRKERYFKRFTASASQYLSNPDKLNDLMIQAKEKLLGGKNQLEEVFDGVLICFRLLKAYTAGEYRNIPAKKVLMIIGAFIYLVSPIDAVFDFLPGGLIDDGAIFLWLFSTLKTELNQFKQWEMEKEPIKEKHNTDPDGK